MDTRPAVSSFLKITVLRVPWLGSPEAQLLKPAQGCVRLPGGGCFGIAVLSGSRSLALCLLMNRQDSGLPRSEVQSSEDSWQGGRAWGAGWISGGLFHQSGALVSAGASDRWPSRVPAPGHWTQTLCWLLGRPLVAEEEDREPSALSLPRARLTQGGLEAPCSALPLCQAVS